MANGKLVGDLTRWAKGLAIFRLFRKSTFEVFNRAARSPPDRSQEAWPGRPFCDENFDGFLVSIFGRFGAVLGLPLGVILALLG